MAIKLNQKDIDFIQSAGMEKVKTAAYHFIRTKLINGEPIPDRGHPVFKAMRAIGIENRASLEDSFEIPKKSKIDELQVEMLAENIMGWIRGELTKSGKVQARISRF